MLRTFRRVLVTSASAVGLSDRVAASRWRRSRLLILAYHGVSQDDEHVWNPELFVSPEFLRERFEMIRRAGGTVLSLADATRRLYDGTLPPRSVTLTFDDGGADFALNAVPLLREFQFPATVYASTYYASRGGAVFNPMLRYLLWHARGRTIDGHGLTADGAPLDLGDDRREQSALRVEEYFREQPTDAKDAALGTIAQRGGVDYDRILERRILQLMTPAEIAALPRDLVDVQLHTHRHRSPATRSEFHREVIENRECLASMGIAAGDLTHFCYPGGRVRSEYPSWLRELGIQTATTCQTGLASRSDDPLLLPRLVDTSTLSAVEFQSWLSGLGAALSRWRRPTNAMA